MVTIPLDDWLEHLDSLPPTEAGKCGWSGCPGTEDEHACVVVDLSNTGRTWAVYVNDHHRGQKTWWVALGRGYARYFPYADLDKAMGYAQRRVEGMQEHGREALLRPTHVVRRKLEEAAA